MERFQASPTYPQQFNADEAPWRPLNGTAVAVAPPEEYTHSALSIAVDASGEDITYVRHNSADAVFFVPERYHYVSGSAYTHDIADWGLDLAGIGAQFDAYPYWDPHSLTFLDN